MKEEFISLQKNNTWELVDLPPRRKLVQCQWVLKTKFDADGSPLKYKEILVAKGYSQVFPPFHTPGSRGINLQATRGVLGGKSRVKAVSLFLTPTFRLKS